MDAIESQRDLVTRELTGPKGDRRSSTGLQFSFQPAKLARWEWLPSRYTTDRSGQVPDERFKLNAQRDLDDRKFC